MLRLRELQTSDEPLLVQYLNNPNVTRFLSSRIPKPYTQADAHWWVETGSKDKAIVRAMEYDGVFCGVVGVYTQAFEYAHTGEVGYWLAEEFWGQGITTQALRQFCDDLFNQTKLTLLYAPIFAPNMGSRRVLEKAGFELEGQFRQALCKDGVYYDEYRFARLKTS